MLKVPAKLLFTLYLFLLLTAALSPAARAASTAQTTPTTPTQPPVLTIKIPSGSYMLSCNSCQFSGTSYSCKCAVYNNLDSSLPSYPTSKIDLSTCKMDSSGFYNLTNSMGKLICTPS